MRTVSSLLVGLLLSGCATLDKDECAAADWYAIGLEDGARGRAVERLGDHRRACAKHKVVPDPARYVAGRNEGLKSFDEVEKDIGRSKAALKDGIPNPRARAYEVERLEALTRESQQLEARIQEAERR